MRYDSISKHRNDTCARQLFGSYARYVDNFALKNLWMLVYGCPATDYWTVFMWQQNVFHLNKISCSHIPPIPNYLWTNFSWNFLENYRTFVVPTQQKCRNCFCAVIQKSAVPMAANTKQLSHGMTIGRNIWCQSNLAKISVAQHDDTLIIVGRLILSLEYDSGRAIFASEPNGWAEWETMASDNRATLVCVPIEVFWQA